MTSVEFELVTKLLNFWLDFGNVANPYSDATSSHWPSVVLSTIILLLYRELLIWKPGRRGNWHTAFSSFKISIKAGFKSQALWKKLTPWSYLITTLILKSFLLEQNNGIHPYSSWNSELYNHLGIQILHQDSNIVQFLHRAYIASHLTFRL